MATVMVHKGENGGICYVDDAYLQTLTPEEIRENQRKVIEVAKKIAMKYLIDEAIKKEKEKEKENESK